MKKIKKHMNYIHKSNHNKTIHNIYIYTKEKGNYGCSCVVKGGSIIIKKALGDDGWHSLLDSQKGKLSTSPKSWIIAFKAVKAIII